jgi:hypothetical protein
VPAALPPPVLSFAGGSNGAPAASAHHLAASVPPLLRATPNLNPIFHTFASRVPSAHQCLRVENRGATGTRLTPSLPRLTAPRIAARKSAGNHNTPQRRSVLSLVFFSLQRGQVASGGPQVHRTRIRISHAPKRKERERGGNACLIPRPPLPPSSIDSLRAASLASVRRDPRTESNQLGKERKFNPREARRPIDPAMAPPSRDYWLGFFQRAQPLQLRGRRRRQRPAPRRRLRPRRGRAHQGPPPRRPGTGTPPHLRRPPQRRSFARPPGYSQATTTHQSSFFSPCSRRTRCWSCSGGCSSWTSRWTPWR